MRDLIAQVRTLGADAGFAWDGDGDRLGLVDERGVRYEGDWISALLARDVLARHPGARILLDLKTSRAVIEDVAAHGGRPVLARTGYSLFRRTMHDEGILFGGETSGHLIFGEDYPCLDDGVYAACAVARILAAEPRPLSAHFASLRRLQTSPEINLPCPDADKFAVAAAVAAHFRDRFPTLEIDGARVDFGDAWALIRASNTNPVLSVRIEAETRPRYDAVAGQVWQALAVHPSVDLPPTPPEPAVMLEPSA